MGRKNGVRRRKVGRVEKRAERDIHIETESESEKVNKLSIHLRMYIHICFICYICAFYVIYVQIGSQQNILHLQTHLFFFTFSTHLPITYLLVMADLPTPPTPITMILIEAEPPADIF